MKPTLNLTPLHRDDLLGHLAKRTVGVLEHLNRRLDEQDEEIRKLKHRVRKLENKNV